MLALLSAVSHAQRLRIIAELYSAEQDEKRIHVSELARRLGLSRPLLYMHLERLETAGLVVGNLELSGDGKAMKYFELVPFAVTLDAETITAAVREHDPVAASATAPTTGTDTGTDKDTVVSMKGEPA